MIVEEMRDDVIENKMLLNKKLGKVELGDWEIGISKFPNSPSDRIIRAGKISK